eukprot:GHVS01017819.1.p1 GENE.GHVS01017819.1~~GHVS01017819.1.p1  ORF type:complete len:167 (-),score=31.02 GHVS01017819.1:472-972(-)
MVNSIPLTDKGTLLSNATAWLVQLKEMVTFEDDILKLVEEHWIEYVKADAMDYTTLALAIDFKEGVGHIVEVGGNGVEIGEDKVKELEEKYSVKKREGTRKWLQSSLGVLLSKGEEKDEEQLEKLPEGAKWTEPVASSQYVSSKNHEIEGGMNAESFEFCGYDEES